MYLRGAVFTFVKIAVKCDSFQPHYTGKDSPWLTFLEDHVFESEEYMFLELHATAMLCLPSGECLRPDATVCAALMSALYACVSEEDVLDRQLMVLPSSNVCYFYSLSFLFPQRYIQVCIVPGRKFFF